MTDDLEFDHQVRVAVQTAARAVIEPPGLTDRLINSALHPVAPAPHPRTRLMITRRLLPAVAVAAAVVVVALVTTAVVSDNADRHTPVVPPAHSTTPAVPTGSVTSPSAVVPAPPVTTPPSVSQSAPAGQPVPAGFVPSSASFLDADHGWAIGWPTCKQDSCATLIRTTDGGATWRQIATSGLSLTQSQSTTPYVVFANDRDGWVYSGALYSTHDGGSTWAKQSPGGGSGTPTVIGVGAGSGYVEALEQSCAHPTCQVLVYRSTVGSDAWRAVSPAVSDEGSLGPEPTQLIVKGLDWWFTAGTMLYHGHGSSAPTSLSYPGGLIAVADAQHLDAYTVSDPGAGQAAQQLWGTTNGGSSWQKTGPSFVGEDNVTGISDSTQGVLLVSASSGDSVLLRTKNDGASFAKVLTDPSSGGTPWSAMAFVTPTEAFAVIGGLDMYVSHNAGVTWSKVTF